MLRFARASVEFLETPVISEEATLAVFENAPRPRAIDQARFVPGDIIVGRYRIVGLLGSGGMGEVYRADDLKLAQPVALKFLAESLSRSGAAQARFHREVSLARQISHRHVCRVYDIGEHAGMHFLTMEYIRGEELSSLLRRIGRLPIDKALQTARQLCAGLAAIHAAGVLHRDLKPSNVMIDERGDVRITDFGIAALTESVSGHEAMIGTPAYMAPEQLEGGEVTQRSDLYSLGLVLHEAFTGKRPPATVTDLDPLVERVILRCIEEDPARRPASAMQVAAALPGGDPLAAALAAGETPSPQMVAAAQREGSLRPLHATLLLLSIFAGFVVIGMLADRTALHGHLTFPLSPEVLRERAIEVTRDAGATAPAADTAWGVRDDFAVVRHVVEHDRRPDRWERFRAAPLPAAYFWYRRSPRPLVPGDFWHTTTNDPPHAIAGMSRVHLDMEGRLLLFEAVPPQDESRPAPPRRADWAPFFERAGLPMQNFQPVPSRWTPPHHSDERVSWTGVHPRRPEITLRIEASSYRGVPVWFEVIWPWQKPPREAASTPPTDPFELVLLAFYFGAIALAVLLAWKNLRAGRGDRRGAVRLMLFMFVVRMVYWLFMAHHVASAPELMMLINGLSSATYMAALLGLLYLALEPFVRRRWPERLISWTRLLAGDFRDPLVGRHVLIGFALAFVMMLATANAPTLLAGRPIVRPAGTSELVFLNGLQGLRGFMQLLANELMAALLFPLILTTVFLFFAMVTRRNRVGFAVSWLLLYFALNLNFGDGTLLGYATGAVFPTLLIVAFARFGLLTLSAMLFATHLL
ncbi:MAG TPA: serine/threonine-protein kinase, partial [Thermoanaerobaculia bacterium]|nr:serine/threonine-protein kinase [Thermoanaerobaculia bacterium]